MSDFDALTDLFLSEGGPAVKPRAPSTLRLADPREPESDDVEADRRTSAPPPQRAPRGVVVEGLILGHLPVFGSAWVTQYAKHRAEQLHEPVTLLRYQEGQAWVDLITPRTAADAPQSRVGAMTGEADSLEQALATAGKRSRHVLVRVDDTNEPDLPRLAGLSAITLLTGANDAAVVASYRTIKGLCHLSTGSDSSDSERTITINLAVMGAEDAAAADAQAKLRRAAQTFLGRDIDTVTSVAKIGACSTSVLFRGDATVSLKSALELLSGAPSSAREVEPKPIAAPTRMEAVAHAPVASPVNPSPAVARKPTGRPHEAATSKSDVLPDGLALIRSHCPYAPNVLLATNGDGSLHLIASVGPSPEYVRELLTAASWSGEHAALLAAAFSSLNADALRAGPTLHVLTEDARAVRGLLDTAVRAHLVVRTRSGPVVSPLN